MEKTMKVVIDSVGTFQLPIATAEELRSQLPVTHQKEHLHIIFQLNQKTKAFRWIPVDRALRLELWVRATGRQLEIEA